MLVTLGGCHLLEGLVVVSVEARKKLMWCSEEELCEGHCARPQETRRAILVEYVIELPSLLRWVLVVPDVQAWRVMPISHRTNK